MKNIFYKLFFGKPEYNIRLPDSAFRNQCLIVQRIWNNTEHNDVGIEKILRLFLATIQFAFPTLYIRNKLWKRGYIYQILAVEIYVIFKTLLPLILLFSGLYNNKILIGIIYYLMFETVCYIANIIFIPDQLVAPRSYKRSILLILIGYIQIVFDFSVIYAGLHLLKYNTQSNDIVQNVCDNVYFSFVTSATIGYGEIVPFTSFGKDMVCVQSFLFFVFVVLFLNFFSSRIGQEFKDYYEIQKEKEKNNTQKKEA